MFLFLLFLDTTLAPFQHCSSSSTPLLLLDTIFILHIASTSLFPLNVVDFPFNIATVPLVLD
jgi:hypothetical protein